MTHMRWGRKMLWRNGRIAMDPACCCTDVCECNSSNADAEIEVTFSNVTGCTAGCMTAMTLVSTGGGVWGYSYTYTDYCGGGYTYVSFEMRCNGESPNQWEGRFQITDSGSSTSDWTTMPFVEGKSCDPWEVCGDFTLTGTYAGCITTFTACATGSTAAVA